MTTAGKRLIEAAKEVRAIARREKLPARAYWHEPSHSDLAKLREYVRQPAEDELTVVDGPAW